MRHELIATDRADLWNGAPYTPSTINNAVSYDEDGNNLNGNIDTEQIFTGTNGDGMRISNSASDLCEDWTATTGVTEAGLLTSNIESWIADDASYSCNVGLKTRIYCIGNYEPQIPTATATPTVTNTATATNTATPTPTATNTATPTSAATGAPILVGPGMDIPDAGIKIVDNNVTVEVPSVIPVLSAAKKKKVLSDLIESGLSKKNARKALDNKKNYVVTYVVTYGIQSQVAALTQDSQQVSIMAGRSKTVRSRKNRISLRGLTPGGAYAVSYQVEFYLKLPPVGLGKTKRSKKTYFTAPRG